MSAQAALFPTPATPAAKRLRFLGRFDVESQTFPRDAARVIAALDTRRDIEAAFEEVPGHFMRFVETLVVVALAMRIAAAPHERIRELLFAEVPEYLRPLVAPLAKSYQASGAWRRRGE